MPKSKITNFSSKAVLTKTIFSIINYIYLCDQHLVYVVLQNHVNK